VFTFREASPDPNRIGAIVAEAPFHEVRIILDVILDFYMVGS
jgi:hypothetical protein